MIECDVYKQVIRVDTGEYHTLNNAISKRLNATNSTNIPTKYNNMTSCGVLGKIFLNLDF